MPDLIFEVGTPAAVVFEFPQSGAQLNFDLTGGQQGPSGPSGGPGAAARHIHTQASPLAEWIINHNLGQRPLVNITTLGGLSVWAEVLHISDNQARAYFDQPIAGIAYCI